MCVTKNSFFVSSKYLVEILHRLPYSNLSITLSCKDFLSSLKKVLVVCWSFSCCSLYFLCLITIISYVCLLPFDNPHAVPVEIGIDIKPIQVRLNVIELDVLAIISNVSNVFNFVINVLYFLYFFFDLLSREKRDIAITFVCLPVCLFVCLLAGCLSDFHEIWWVEKWWS